MINPQPIQTPNSPYKPEEGRPIVQAVRVPEKRAKRFLGKRIFGIFVLMAIVSVAGYAFSRIRTLADEVIVNNDGPHSQILGYDQQTALDTSKFTKPGDGRFTMAIVGIGGDNHPGAYLTDSIQVISIDTINKTMTTTSVPRDLYVSIPGYGRAKINAVYTYAEQQKVGSGGTVLKQVLSNVLGYTVSNFAMVDFAGAKELVDAIGGIDVDVPKAIYDPFFPADDTIHYAPFSISAGPHHMNGTTALQYARSRETTSDFDRSARQQIIMKAIRDKALSVGVLTNPKTLSDILTTLGKHLKTDLQVDEIHKLVTLYSSIDKANAKTYVLDTSASLGLLTATTDDVAGYIAYPIGGFDRFDPIHDWFAGNNPDPLITKDAPTVTIYGTGKATAKQLQAFADKLSQYGFATTVSTSPASGKSTTTSLMSEHSSQKVVSANYLKAILGVASVNTDHVSSANTSDFEIIYVPSTTAPASTPKVKVSPSPSPSDSATP